MEEAATCMDAQAEEAVLGLSSVPRPGEPQTAARMRRILSLPAPVGGCGVTSLRSKLGPSRMGGVLSIAAKVLGTEGFESVPEMEEAASEF